MAAVVPGPDREIQVRARDRDGALLRGSTISWTEDDHLRGTVEYSDGHMTLYPLSATSTVAVKVTYQGEEQNRKLAIGQTLCEFYFLDKTSSTTTPNSPLTPTPGAASGPGSQTSASPWWSTSAVIAAVITAVSAIIVAYFQFGVGKRNTDSVTLSVYVKDSVSAAPIPRAKVTVQSSSAPAPVISDSQGLAIFELPSGKGESMKIAGSAANYEDGTVVTKASDRPVELLLNAKPEIPASAPVRPSARAPAAAALVGTWEIRISGDLTLKRVRDGTFDFALIPDGRTAVQARIEIDGATTQLNGFASRQNNRLFLDYRAQAGSDSWQGKGQLRITNETLDGYITDAKGQDVPITLRKP